MKFQPLRVSIVRLRYRSTKSYMAREPKNYPRKDRPIRAFGTESRCFTGHGRAHGGAVAGP